MLPFALWFRKVDMVRRVYYASIELDRNTHDTAEAQIDVSCHCKRGYRNSIAHNRS
jgi:hypothetical protein